MNSNVPRNEPALQNRIDTLRNTLISRFEELMSLAVIDKTDRNTTATTQYQMQVEQGVLIRTCEDILALTRQMQELWLFGSLKTIEQSGDVQERIDQDAKEVSDMLAALMASQPATAPSADGDENMETTEAQTED